MEKKKLTLKKFMTPDSAATKLEDLAKAFRAGTITIEKDAESIELLLSDTVEVEITAKEQKNKYDFALELSWFSGLINDDDDDESLSIDPLECVKVVPLKDEAVLAETENNEEFTNALDS